MIEVNDHIQRLHTILFTYRCTPHGSGRITAELFFNKKLCTLIETLNTDVREKIEMSQFDQTLEKKVL